MPKVSIWLTSYNHEKFIGESIESILAQTYTDFELFVIDDCSSDNSWEIIQSYAQKDARIKAVRHAYNQGGSGLEKELSQLNGEYVAIAHCDDAWKSDKLEKQVKVLDENDDVAACFTLVSLIDDNGKDFECSEHHYAHTFEQPNRNRYEWLNYFFYNGNCLCHPSILIRKNAYTEKNIFAIGLHAYPDFCKWIKLCKQSEIFIIQEELTKFRLHGDGSNTSGENIGNLRTVSIEEYFVLKEYVELLDSEDIMKVFPEMKEYVVDGKICKKYAFAKMLLNGARNSYQLLGLELLYDLIRNPKTEQEILELYGYSRKMFKLDKWKYDVFHVIPDVRCLNVSLFLNGQQGYNEVDKVTTTAFVRRTGEFAVNLNLRDYSLSMLTRIRVDLDEGRYRKFKICKCTCNGERVEMVPVNGRRKDEWDEFYTMDPQYEICLAQNGCLCIEGYTEEILCGEIEQYFGGVQQRCNMLSEEIIGIKNSKVWKTMELVKRLLRK